MFISIIIPVYNEESNIIILHENLESVLKSLKHQYEMIFINDGSDDQTEKVLQELSHHDPTVKFVSFSNNFGKESAMYCGMEHAQGDVAIILDADMQHPPSLIPDMLKQYELGYHQVIAKRNRVNESFIKRVPATIFYKFSNFLTDINLKNGEGDFRLISRSVIDAILNMEENNRFLKGLFEWVGYSKTTIWFKHQERSEGKSKFSLLKLFDYAIDGIISFNNKPLRFCFFLGGFTLIISLLYILITFLGILKNGIQEPGYFTVISSILFLGGLQLFSLGIVGEYIGRIYYETKDRPKYIVKNSSYKDELNLRGNNNEQTND